MLVILFLELILKVYQPLVCLMAPFTMYILFTVNAFIVYARKKWENQRHSSIGKVSKPALLKTVCENSLYLVFTLLLFLYSFNLYSEDHSGSGGFGLRAWYLIIPLSLALILYVFCTKWPSNSCSSTMHFVQIGGMILRSGILMTLFLKMSSVTSIGLITVFW